MPDLDAEITRAKAAEAQEVVDRDAAIAASLNNLVGTVPGTLDTLQDLAEAIGSDDNFAVTMTNKFTDAQTDRAAIRRRRGQRRRARQPRSAGLARAHPSS